VADGWVQTQSSDDGPAREGLGGAQVRPERSPRRRGHLRRAGVRRTLGAAAPPHGRAPRAVRPPGRRILL